MLRLRLRVVYACCLAWLLVDVEAVGELDLERARLVERIRVFVYGPLSLLVSTTYPFLTLRVPVVSCLRALRLYELGS